MTTKPNELDPELIADAFLPLYGRQEDPAELIEECADRLGELFEEPLVLQLPESVTGRSFTPPPKREGWELEFEHDGALGRVVGLRGLRPPEPVLEALTRELKRFSHYLGVLRGFTTEYDRLHFRLRALHQITRTLTVAREQEEAEIHIVDFSGEMFFSWWTALYLPRRPGVLEAARVRALQGRKVLPTIESEALDEYIEIGAEPLVIQDDERIEWLPQEVRVLAPLDMGEERLGCLMLGDRMNEEDYGPDDLQLLGTVAHASAVALRNAELLERLKERAVVDELTGLYNRRFFDARLAQEFDRAARYKRPLSLILMDLDYFKEYNDTYGHSAGDVLLARVAAIIRASIRKVDVGCRYGGEEFAVIAPETSRANATLVGERLNAAIGAIQAIAGIRKQVTVSVGVAAYPEDANDPSQLVETADQALYRAKEEGRDRVTVAGA